MWFGATHKAQKSRECRKSFIQRGYGQGWKNRV